MSAPSLISSIHGPIRRALFAIPYWVLRYGHQVEIRPYRLVFEALLQALPQRTEHVVLTHAEVHARAVEWLAELGLAKRSSVVSVPDDHDFTVWSQDACVVQRGADGVTRLVAPSRFERDDDAAVARHVARALGLDHRRCDLRFQGGNVLVGDDFWLVGADAVRQTVLAGHAADEVVARSRFAATLDSGRRLYVVGTDEAGDGNSSRPLERAGGCGESAWEEGVRLGSNDGTHQPLFDLDGFVSLAGRGADGRYRLLVGDPRLASEVTGSPLQDHAHAARFDAVAAALSGWGFDVIRNPLPLVYHDDRVLRRRRWYFASSNNVVAEIDGAVKTVWLPTYGDADYPELAATDRCSAEIWQRLGFEVQRLPNCHAFARGLGAAHCICKRLPA